MSAITPESGDSIVVSDENGVDRVIIGEQVDGDYGIRIVSSDGEQVIIDGDSNVFKIVATGTMSKTVAAGANGITVRNLPELGTFTAVPVMIGIISPGLGAVGNKYLGIELDIEDVFVSLTSGGSTTHKTTTIQTFTTMYAMLEADDTVSVVLEVYNVAGPGSITRYGRYYVMQEAAL
jgi:hypothetical protein